MVKKMVQLVLIVGVIIAFCKYTIVTYESTKAALVAAEEECAAAEKAVKSSIIERYEPDRTIDDIKVYKTWQKGYEYTVNGRHISVNNNPAIVRGIDEYIRAMTAVDRRQIEHDDGIGYLVLSLLASLTCWVVFKFVSLNGKTRAARAARNARRSARRERSPRIEP